TVPIFFPLSEWTNIRAASKDREVAQLNEDSLRLNSLFNLQSAYTKFQASERQRENLNKFILPAAKASYDLVLKSYSLGRADYLRLNDARQVWIQAKRDYLSKTLESTMLYNALTLQVGCDLSGKEEAHACQ